jgi:hypothetical protein
MSHEGFTIRLSDLPKEADLARQGYRGATNGSRGKLTYTTAERSYLSSGPMSKTDTETFTFRLVSGFRTKSAANVRITFDELVGGLTARTPEEKAVAAAVQSKFKQLNPRGSIPISLKVLAANVGTEKDMTAHYSLRVCDAKGKSIHNFNTYKHGRDDIKELGFPLQLVRGGHHDALGAGHHEVLDDHRKYWHIDLKNLTEETTQFVQPVTRQECRLIPSTSISAHLCHFALSVKNNVLEDLINNPAHRFSINGEPSDVIMLSMKHFNDVYKAYAKKLREVDKMSYDISTISVHLVANPLSEEVRDQDDIAYITWELAVHLPIKDGPNADVAAAVRGVSKMTTNDDDDDEEDEDEIE